MFEKFLNMANNSKAAILCFGFILAFLWFPSYAQVRPITQINLNNNNSPTQSNYTSTAPSDAQNLVVPNQAYNSRFGRGVNVIPASFDISDGQGGTDNYANFVPPDTFAIRRTDGSSTLNLWYEYLTIDQGKGNLTGNNAPFIELSPSQVANTDAVYNEGFINVGYDNILVNEDDLAGASIQSQIERVDVIWYAGIATPTPENAVFSVLERGGNDQVKIAAILSLDNNLEPSSYSSMVTINGDEAGTTNDWPGTGYSVPQNMVYRRESVGNSPLPLLDLATAQVVQGVAIGFQDLGISANQTVYGFSLFASDVDANTHTLTDITTFPTDTKSSISGIDLVVGSVTAVAEDSNLQKAVGPGGFKAALSTWLKANETSEVTTSTDGASVTDWQDHWIGDNDFTTGISAPVYVDDNTGTGIQSINFNQSVDFSGNTSLTTPNNEDFNVTGNSSPNNYYSNKGINMVFRTDASDISTRQVLFEQGSSSRGINIYIFNGSLYASAWNQPSDGTGAPWNTSASINTLSTSIATDTEYIITLEQNGNSSISGDFKIYLNGELKGTLSNVGRLYDDTGGIELGASDGSRFENGTTSGTFSFAGEIPEFIYCNEPGSFTAVQRNKTESYLAIKYGITLDQNPTQQNYVSSGGTIIFNTNLSTASGGFQDYDYDIAGIGRDDGSELEQQKSKSENPNSIVTMDKGGAFTDNNTFLVWGNDNGAVSETTSDVPPLISNRIIREWRVAETGDIGNVSVSFDISELTFDLSGSTPAQDDFTLLIAASSSGGAFNTATKVTGGVLSGDILTFSNVDFSQGQFFTLGTGKIVCYPGNVQTNLVMWLEANSSTNTTTNGAAITSWGDQAGSNNASATTGPNFNTNGINFNPSLDFISANSDNMTVANNAALNTDQQALFVISELNSGSGNGAAFILKANDGRLNQGWGLVRNGNAAGAIYTKDGTSTTNTLTYDIPTMHVAYTDASNYNYSLALGTNSSTAKTTLATSTAPIYLGATLTNNGNSLSTFLQGKIGEIIFYGDDLTATERQRVATYLAIKYGITIDQTSGQDYLASDGGIIWSSATNGTYDNDIAGIGRDDDSCLNQKQSKSVNTGAIVTIGNGTINATNLDNSNNFSVNDSWLVWGHDGASANQSSAITSTDDAGNSINNDDDTPLAVSERMLRKWRVQETGTVGNTTISFDLTGLGYSTAAASSFRLLVDADGDMDDANVISGGTLNGSVITFSNVNFNSGDYFTLGTQSAITCGPGGVTTDLVLWLKANEGTGSTTDGADINTWSDQSSSARNASEVNLGGASPSEPKYDNSSFNFNPTVAFTDPNSTNGSYMATSTGNIVSGEMSLISVFSTGQTGGSTTDFEAAPALLSTGSSGNQLDYGLGFTDGLVHFNASSDNLLTARSPGGTTYNDQKPHILLGTRSQSATAGSVQLYADGANVASGTSVATALTANNPNARYGIGNHDNGNVVSQFAGNIGESIVFSSVLSATDRNKVESYLAIKYGITKNNSDNYLAANGSTLVWDLSEDTSYNNDIAGIGRDDKSCFTQLKSKSINDDAIVTMEIGTVTADDSWLLWGNDGRNIEGRNELEIFDNKEFDPTQVQTRLYREWRVQENGTMGTVTLTYDLSAISGPTGVGTNNLNLVRLMVDADGDFTSGVTLYEPTSIDNVNKTVSFTVDFNDTDYFTLGSTELAALPIELVDFDARPVDRGIQVTWSTATETDNSLFTIQRGLPSGAFDDVGFMDGAGNSNIQLYYEFIDRYPKSGINYYRLKQTDINGTFSYSNIKAVSFTPAEQPWLRLTQNPVAYGDVFDIQYSSAQDESIQLVIMDMTGRIYEKKSMVMKSSDSAIQLHTAQLSKGLFIIRARSEFGNTATLKVLIE